MMDFLAVVMQISRILGIRFITAGDDRNIYICRIVQKAFSAQAEGRPDEFRWYLYQLIYLSNDLSTLEQEYPTVLAQLRHSLVSPYPPSYAGARFELYFAAKLARLNIRFSKTESPDFAVKDFAPLYIECTILNLQTQPDGNLMNKFRRAIKKKQGKHYYKRPIILCIDATNIYHNSINIGRNLALGGFRTTLESQLNKTYFDAFIVCGFMIDTVQDKYGYGYDVIESRAASPSTRRFLEKAYKKNRWQLRGYMIPNFA